MLQLLKNIMMAKYSSYFVLLVVLLGIGLRSFHLKYQSLWQDEAYAVLCSNQPISSIIEWQMNDSSPPLYYCLLKLWIILKNTSEFWVRSLSAITGSIFLIAIYFILKSLFNKKCALLGLCITTLSPYHIYYSQEARMYSLLSLLSLLIIYLYTRYFKKKDKFSLWLYVITAIATLYTHNYGIFIVGTGFIFALLKKSENRDKRFLKAHIIILITYLPWIFVILSQLSNNNTAWIHNPELKNLLRSFTYFAGRSWKLPCNFFISTYILAATLVLAIGLLYATYFFAFEKRAKDINYLELENIKATMFFFFVPFLSSFLLSYLKPIYVAGRYDIAFYPYFIALSAYGLSKIKLTRTKYILLLVLLCSNLLILKNYFFTFYKSNDKQLANYIFEKADNSTLLIFTDLSATPFEYYSLFNTKKFDFLRFPGGPKGWIEKDAFLKLRTYSEDKIAEIMKELDKLKNKKNEIWVMYEPYPEINYDLVEALSDEFCLIERTKLRKGDLDNQVTDIYKFKLDNSN
jgi:mannosyltransferase